MVMTNEGQLTLELNVRTAEQQKQIDSFLIREENDMKARIASMKNQYRILVDAGFYSEDIDFKFDIVSVTREINVGSYSDRFEVELTFDTVKGGVKLLRDDIDTKDGEPKIVKRETWFTISDGKIECNILVGSFRPVKPETLFRKLKEHNESVKTQLEYLTERLSNTQKAISELNNEFPQAISIDEKQEWVSSASRRGGYTKNVIEVRFEDGSYVTFEVDTKGEKHIFKVYDIEQEALTKQDKLNRLTNRLKK
jgi:hypothetical protein